MSEELAVGAEGAATEEVTTNHAEETADAKPNGGEADPQAIAKEGEQELEHKRLGGWQRKIQKLERELQAVKSQQAAPVKEEPKPEPFSYDKPEPDPKDFDLGDGTYDVAKYTKAMIQYERDKAKAEDSHEQKHKDAIRQQKEQQSKQVETIKAWRERNAETIKKHADFDEAISAAGPVSQATHEAILGSEVGAELAYYFATNEDEAQRIAALPTWQQIRELTKLEAKFAPQDSAEKREAEDEPADPPPSKAPAPAKPVGKPSAAPAKSIYDDNLPFKEFVKLRNAQTQRK